MATVGELFAGGGLMSLGLERAGLTPIWHAERDKAASQVLAAHWPTIPNLGDVCNIDWTTVKRPDILCLGGWPCQPFSTAGKQSGSSDDRYLWPEVDRALRVLRPPHVIMEQSPALLTRKFRTEWLRCLSDLADVGLDVWWAVLRASDVGAPHGRARLFLVGHAADTDRDLAERHRGPGVVGGTQTAQPGEGDQRQRTRDTAGDRGETFADPNGGGFERWAQFDCEPKDDPADRCARRGHVDGHGEQVDKLLPTPRTSDANGGGPHGDGGQDLRTIVADRHEPGSRLEGSRQGVVLGANISQTWGKYWPAITRWEQLVGEVAPDPLDSRGRLNVELPRWMMGAPEGWTDGLSRSAAIRVYGNGVVVQVAEQVGRWLTERIS